MTAPHRHTWNTTGRRCDGAVRTCLLCPAVQVKRSNRWIATTAEDVRLDHLAAVAAERAANLDDSLLENEIYTLRNERRFLDKMTDEEVGYRLAACESEQLRRFTSQFN